MSPNRWNTNTVSIFQEENKKVRIVSPFTVCIYCIIYSQEIHTHIHTSIEAHIRQRFTPNLAPYLFAPIRIVAQYRLDFSRPPCIRMMRKASHLGVCVMMMMTIRYDKKAKCLSRCFFLSEIIVFISHILRMLSSTMLIVFSIFLVSLVWLPARQCLFLICLLFACSATMVSPRFFYCHVDLCSVLLQKFTFS